MHDLAGMEVAAGGDDLDEDGCGLWLREVLDFLEFVEELPAVAEFGDDVVVVELFVNMVHFEHIGMVQLFEDVEFVEEQGLDFAVLLAVDYLDSPQLPRHSGLGLLDLGVCSLAEGPHHLVVFGEGGVGDVLDHVLVGEVGRRRSVGPAYGSDPHDNLIYNLF